MEGLGRAFLLSGFHSWVGLDGRSWVRWGRWIERVALWEALCYIGVWKHLSGVEKGFFGIKTEYM